MTSSAKLLSITIRYLEGKCTLSQFEREGRACLARMPKRKTSAKQPTRASLMTAADIAFSRFIKQRDTDAAGYGVCCTCGNAVHRDQAEAGHFIGRRHMITRYHDRNVNLQCISCNRARNPQDLAYARYLDEKYGAGTADELRRLSRGTWKPTTAALQHVAKFYRERVAHEDNDIRA